MIGILAGPQERPAAVEGVVARRCRRSGRSMAATQLAKPFHPRDGSGTRPAAPGSKDLHFHDLRHDGATRALNAGVPAPILSTG